MKCGIVTFNQVINYGAALQMFALQHYINEELDCECEVINYYSRSLQQEYDKPSIRKMLHPKVILSFIINNTYTTYNYEGFERFKHQNIRFSKNCYKSIEDLRKAEDEYDFFIAGSDQVFNLYCCKFDDAFMLSFVDDNKKKNSYAASLGITNIPNELKEQYRTLLGGFNHISVRETVSSEVLYNLLGFYPQVCVDPCFLLLKQEWDEIATPINVNKEYIFLYLIIEDRKILHFVRKLAKKNKLDIIYVNDRFLKPFGMVSYRKISPDQWIYLLKNAKIVVTNSYHGIVFSCIYKKIFYPFLLQKNVQVNSRIRDILKKFELDRLIIQDSYDESVLAYDSIDFSYYEVILENERKNSIEFLTRMIGEYSEKNK